MSVAISIEGLTKRFGAVTAVDDLTFEVAPGRVTGFLGPNGSGKTTTLRMVLGLIAPTAGRAMIGGRPYREISRPMRLVGAALEASSFHPGRTGLGHLQTLAPQTGVSTARCHQVLDFVGLATAGDRRVGGYSTGMRQRLALAAALLGDPQVIVLDEPANGLDPQGIVWLRELLRSLAYEGRTVLVSSHVLAEVRSTVDDVVVIGGGRLIRASTLADFESLAERAVGVRTPAADAFAQLAAERGWMVSRGPGGFRVDAQDCATVGAAAFAAGIELHQLTDIGADLESVFLRLTTSPDAPTGHLAPQIAAATGPGPHTEPEGHR
ncbi:ATP-binding cassette domain-containing protein [Gordonia sp. HNM0687]|uniref:ATP-binding cassette domain-containing protein n=1 Tax=Gordonia mangrovi TaxID=2665643 RepID=A0A6L7GMR1_9ACTN|nr:ATP-binding cassette domain-containing protein [Gordonia mangrovi]MXP21224.1 ATP-binding cassette domain-containing protein [Gordonia mangrovi]UVF78247.1 ATP-binding cassette domain-containing protein [Gordonia mangrovi]